MSDHAMRHALDHKRVLIIGGTGSLGKVLTSRLLSGLYGRPRRITVMSRDEAKHHDMRVSFHNMASASEDIAYKDNHSLLNFRVGCVRDPSAVRAALRDTDVVFNAAALKQVPSCEYYPSEAIETNILGPRNIIRAILDERLPIEAVIGISTDKACHPVNVMGMTKALQERLFIAANIDIPATRFGLARYGNVLASRGSVIPLFHTQIANGGPVTLTEKEMTRYLLTLTEAADTIVAAYALGERGDTFIPRAPAARIEMLARVLIGDRPIRIDVTGIRPGEKIHETLVADDEAVRTVERGNYYVIRSSLPELGPPVTRPALSEAYTSGTDLMDEEQLLGLLARTGLRVEDRPDFSALY